MTTDDAVTLGLVVAIWVLWLAYELRPKPPTVPLKWGGKVPPRTPALVQWTDKGRVAPLMWRAKYCTERQAVKLMIWKSGETLRDELEKREREKMA